jgi:hypothetical protein
MRLAFLLLVSTLTACAAAGESVGKVEQPLSTDLVISQVYGSGGSAAATYDSDFVELFNRGASPVSLSGMSIQYASAAGTSWLVTTLPAKSIPAGGYFLIGLAGGIAGGGTALPSADATGTTNMGGANGRVALVKATTALGCGAVCQSDSNVVDFVGFGTATDHEGSGAAPTAGDASHSVQRKSGGCTETDDNGADFESQPVAPRNSATAAAPCGTVTDASTTEDAALDSTAATDTGAASEDATVDSSTTLPDAPAAETSTKKGTPSDLPTASTCAIPHNPSHPRAASELALFALALGIALTRRALR